MAFYMKYSTKIYNIYLKYFSEEDIYVYSIDEIFCDITPYLKIYKMRAKDLVTKVIQDVYKTTGITATAGIGTNLYLCKVAMDIVAKHIKPDKNGVRIAGLDEMTYRKLLWTHTPITDFWRVGKGYSKKLEKHGIYTMGDVARTSIENEELLYKLFGINAELLIDHAWGYEPCTIKEIKSYKPEFNSISSGQVLHCPYDYEKTKLIVKEMTELLALDLVEKKLVTNQLVLTIGYDVENLKNEEIRKNYKGEITEDRYGRKVPKHAHGTINLDHKTSSTKLIMEAVTKLYDQIINEKLLTSHHIFTHAELHSRYEIKLENYVKTLHIEAGTLVEIIQKDLLPAVTTYMEKLAQTAALKKSVVPDISVSTEATLLTKLTELSEAMTKDLETLKQDTAMAEYEVDKDLLKSAKLYQSVVLTDMEKVRASADAAEALIPDSILPYPTYGKLLFSISD